MEADTPSETGRRDSTPAARSGASSAPYMPDAAGERPLLDARRPWKEAGRSHLAVADRLTADHRRTSGPVSRWRTPHEATDLRARAAAARTTARLLEPLRASGWVVLHDRLIAGTSAVLDHVLVGPAGLVVINNRVDPSGSSAPG